MIEKYIEANKLYKEWDDALGEYDAQEILQSIDMQPAADVRLNVYAKLKHTKSGAFCSECGHGWSYKSISHEVRKEIEEYIFCPYCGSIWKG